MLLETGKRNQSTDAVLGNILNCALTLQKLAGFQFSWLLTFCELYLAAQILKMQR